MSDAGKDNFLRWLVWPTVAIFLFMVTLPGIWFGGSGLATRTQKTQVATSAGTSSLPDVAVVEPVINWPLFHGNAALTGYVDVKLPDKPEVLWRFKTKDKLPIKSSPIIADGRVYFGSFDDSLYALNVADGSIAWKAEAGATIEGTPCYANGIVYVGSLDTNVYAFDAKTGKPVWTFKTGDAVKGGPNVVNGKVLIGSYDSKLYSLDAKTGKLDWSFETSNYVYSTPSIWEGRTVFGGCDGLLHILNIADGKEEKSIEAGAYIAASAAIDGGVAYVGHHESEFLAFDLKKGEVIWRFPCPNGEAFMSSPALSKDFAVVGCEDKGLYCLSRTTGKAVWSYLARGKINSSPAIASDRVLMGDEKGRVYMLALKDGSVLWEYEIGAPVDTSPAISNTMFVFGANDGSVTAFGKKK